jgi:hypothetical protein
MPGSALEARGGSGAQESDVASPAEVVDMQGRREAAQ